MMGATQTSGNLPDTFEAAAKRPAKRRIQAGATSPFSIRLTEAERAALRENAGNQPLSAYIRKSLLGDQVPRRRRTHKPTINDAKIAHALAGLGQSRLASNMNQIAHSANIGVLDVSPELISELETACHHIREMRNCLIKALGLKCENNE